MAPLLLSTSTHSPSAVRLPVSSGWLHDGSWPTMGCSSPAPARTFSGRALMTTAFVAVGATGQLTVPSGLTGGAGVGVGIGVGGGSSPSPPLTGMMSTRTEATPVPSNYSTRSSAGPLNQ